MGNTKNNMEASAIVNPKIGKLTVSKNEIKKGTLEYCMETLANNKPEVGFEKKLIGRKRK